MSLQFKPFDTLFLDRDGVINKKIDNGYVTRLSEIEILPGIPAFLAWAAEAFQRIVVVTNQRCVGRGIISAEELAHINHTINERTGNKITRFFCCPHLQEAHCLCRKPKEGLFLQAAAAFQVDFSNSWMVGDSETDLVPAKKLGISTIFLSAQESRHANVRLKHTTELWPFFQTQR